MKIINKILIITGIIISTLACTNENHNERESIEMNSDIKNINYQRFIILKTPMMNMRQELNRFSLI
ncbi:MAG: hypothetical protein PHY55_01810 [Bacteroidales bacterium]|nr:hypothetical protein [Bacteroidales bacterium]